ncbi:MAG: type I DNA topoisomerase [Patescibacteria group bacterium]|nr:type I DNA topoisomerase [Patescibacteria group bacterium]
MKLIIVESPTKAKTISKFLGSDYKIESSFGHIRDLPKSTLGIDVEKNFEPKYVIPTKARKAVTILKEAAKKADEIVLASDEDREGEAIAWHLAEVLNIKPQAAQRIVFHEITKDAILKALETPRHLDENLFNAQQARRVLDRLVGYELSPLLWKKVARGLSAGRVQSVALKLIVEREREIKAFQPIDYWKIKEILKAKEEFTAELAAINNETLDKLSIKSQEEADNIKTELENLEHTVQSVETKIATKKAPTPFKTSTLQQTANRRLGWSAKQTMVVAQKLYEKGFITYMRTDSLNLSEKFLAEADKYLIKNFGKEYSSPKHYKTKAKGAQEAHEAIRPTEATREPSKLKTGTDANEKKLYELIWSRSIASQMPDALFDSSKAIITAGQYELIAQGLILKFDGFLKIYSESTGESELPVLTDGEKLTLVEVKTEANSTKPPARYSDATLVKELEKNEIGRPSTYAPTIATLENRNYIERAEDKRLKPTDIAFIVNDLLVEHFPDIVNLEFTAKMEKKFDKIADGKISWQPVIAKFYEPFHQNIEDKTKELNKADIMPEERTQELCDKCESPMVIKIGRFGKFLACSNFPACKNTRQIGEKKASPEETEELKALNEKYKGERCSKCDHPMMIKTGRFGAFLACSAYPKCKNIKNIQEGQKNIVGTGIKCPACEKGEITPKKSRFGIFYACSNYPDCKNAYWGKPTGEKCPDCEALLIENKKGGISCSSKTCKFTK